VAVVGILGLAHILSFTRGALLSTALVLAIVGWKTARRQLIAWGPSLIVAIAIVLMAWTPTRERLISIVTIEPPAGETDMDAGAWRYAVVPLALRMLVERPLLGYGIDQQQHNWPADGRHLIPHGIDGLEIPVHNTYLLSGIEVGLPGLAVLIVLIVFVLRRLLRSAKRWRSLGAPDMAAYALAMFAAVAGLAAAGLAYPLLGNYRYFWLLMAMTASMLEAERRLADVPDAPRQRLESADAHA
jgi:O-antigen ligase